MPPRNYPEFTDVTFHCRYLRPGQITPPYTSHVYTLIDRLLKQRRSTLLQHIRIMATYRERLLELARAPRTPANTEPHFEGEFSDWDACLLYAMIRHYRPKKIVEIGSGSSTRFMRQAITDGGLATELVVVDSAVKDSWTSSIASQIIESHFEDVWTDPRLKLNSGDMLFYSGTHFVIPGSDLVRLCLEYIPRLPDDVLIHFHDVFPPGDGPASIRRAMIFEAYMVYAMMFYGHFDLECTIWPLQHDKEATAIFPPFPPELKIKQYGGSLWLRKRGQGQ